MSATPTGPGPAAAPTAAPAAPTIKPIPTGRQPGAAPDAFGGLKLADGDLGDAAGQPGALDWMSPKPDPGTETAPEPTQTDSGEVETQTQTEPDAGGYQDGPIKVLGKTFKNREHLEQAINSLRGLARKGNEDSAATQKLLTRIEAMEKALEGDKAPAKTPPDQPARQTDPTLPLYQTIDWSLYERLEKEGGRGYALSYLLDHVGSTMEARYGAALKDMAAKYAEVSQALQGLMESGVLDLTQQHQTHSRVVSFANRLEALATAKAEDGSYLYPELTNQANIPPPEFWREFSDRVVQLGLPADQALTPRMFRAICRELLSDLQSGAFKVDWSPSGPKPVAAPTQGQDLAGSGGADLDLTPTRSATPPPGRTRPRSAEADAIARIFGNENVKRDKDLGISI